MAIRPRTRKGLGVRVIASVAYAFLLGVGIGLPYRAVLLVGLVPVAFWLLGPRYHKGYPWWARLLRVLGAVNAGGAAFIGGAVLATQWQGAPVGHEYLRLYEELLLFFIVFELFVAAPAVLTSEAWRWLDRLRHHGQGLCRSCGYDLRGLPSQTCPECGQDQRRPGPERTVTGWFERRWRMWHPLQRAGFLVLAMGTPALVLAWYIRGKAWWDEPAGVLAPLAGPIIAAALAIVGRDLRRRRLERLEYLVCTGCGEVLRPQDEACPRCEQAYTHENLVREWKAVAEWML